MKLGELKLRGFRHFRQVDIEFGKRLTVFVGINGAGKTSVVDALAILLSRLIGRIRSTRGAGRFFTESDIRKGMRETVNSLEIEFDGKPVSWRTTKARRGRRRQTITNLSAIKDIVEQVYDDLDENENASIPMAVFYGVNRAVLDVPLRIRTRHVFDQLAAYDQALDGGRNDFRRFFEWFRGREDLENERRLSPVEHVGKERSIFDAYRDRQLQAVRKAIHELTGFSNLRIKRSPLRMEVRKGDLHFDVRQLSDGEKCLIALAGDLAHRLAIANPDFEKPLEGRAVVLIDEVDLHLHPEWQHRIIPGLLETFPNCQFVLTTHSPQVLSHVRCKNIRCLIQNENEIDILHPDGTYGQDSNFLLKTLLGSNYRPREIDEDIHRLFGLINHDTGKARRLLDELRTRVEGESPDLVRAETLLHRREMSSK